MAQQDLLSSLLSEIDRLRLSDAVVVEHASALGLRLAEKTVWNLRNGRHSPTYRTVEALQKAIERARQKAEARPASADAAA